MEQGRSATEVADSLGVSENVLYSWKRKLLAGGTALPKEGQKSVTELERENRELKKKLAQAQLDRDILNKATAYFAKDES